jgi:hypothetical protein
MALKLTFEPDEDFTFEAFNDPFIHDIDGKPHLFMLAADTELGHDVEVLIIEITEDMTEKKARKIAELLKLAGNYQAQANEERG